MRSGVVVLVVLVACSSFDATDAPATSPPDGGAAPDAPGTSDASGSPAAPVKLAAAAGTISALCASTRGVAWLRTKSVGAVIDGIERPEVALDGNTNGSCHLDGTVITYTESTAVRILDLMSPTDTPGSPLFNVGSPGPVTKDGTTFLTVETLSGRRIMEAPGNGPMQSLGVVTGTARWIRTTAAVAVVGTSESKIFLALRGQSNVQERGASGSLSGIAIASGMLFASDAAGGTIATCALPGCENLSAVTTGLRTPIQVAADRTDIVWLEQDTGRIAACDPASCTPRTLATHPGAAHLAVGDRVYFADGTTSEIYAIPR